MFTNKLPALVLGAALTLSPGVALAERQDREHRHQHHFSVQFGYPPGYANFNGGYERRDRWRPRGFYDRWGFWHPYPRY